ncbi:MAG: pilus assembly protein PilP [Candidatus Sedimenticola sp. PURPLELP]
MTGPGIRFMRNLLVCTVPFFLVACAGDMQDLKKYVQEVKSRKAGHIEPLPEIKQVETYAFVGGVRSPFFLAEGEAMEGEVVTDGGISPDTTRRKEELESYELDALRMVGILEQLETRWALIQTKENTIYRVKTGNYMGKNHGQITRITETQADLTEIIPDGQGGYRERQASLALTE